MKCPNCDHSLTRYDQKVDSEQGKDYVRFDCDWGCKLIFHYPMIWCGECERDAPGGTINDYLCIFCRDEA